jgi:hypothetical protein
MSATEKLVNEASGSTDEARSCAEGAAVIAGYTGRGRKPASESRAAEIRTKLIAWKNGPEQQRVSLRTLALELGTSHQLLSSYVRGLNKWQAKDYKRRAEAIRNLAWSENRCLMPWEESQAAALDRAAFQCMIESALTYALKRYEAEFRENKVGKVTKSKLKLVRMLAQKGFPGAEKLLRKYQINLPSKPMGKVKSFRSDGTKAGNSAKTRAHAVA